MMSNIFQWRSLKTRVTLFTLAIFLAGIWSLGFYASRVLREDMQRQLGDQQFSTVSVVAEEVNEELDSRLQALQDIAGNISPALLGNTAAMQAYLERLTFLHRQFNGGAFVTRMDGTAIADIPLAAGRIGVNYMDRDYMDAALKQGKATIGRPVLGKKLRAPIIGMTAPIRDARGKVIGSLTGVTNLGQPNFLDKITQSRYGMTGGYLIIAPQYRLIVTATDKSRVMEVLPAAGIIPLIDRFIQGYEGTAVIVNPKGVEVLASDTSVPAAGWIMAAVLPTAEAFAPIYAMQQHMLLATLLLTLLAGGLTWWMLRRQLSPMLATVKTLAALSNTNQHPQPLPINSQDEIGELIGGFNGLLKTLGQREAALQESKEHYRRLAEDMPFYLVTSLPDGTLTYANDAISTLVHMTPAQLIGKNFFEFLSVEDRKFVKARLASLTPEQPLETHEQVYLGLGETILYHQWTNRAFFDDAGKVTGFQAFGEDITERKQMGDQVRQLAFYDSLTKLPNRRLLSDRLTQTLAACKRSGCYVAVMFLDLDNFKPLNDTHGHVAGDLLLIEAADRLKSCVREMDTVARFGGDEFVVVLGDLNVDKAESAAQAALVAEKIRAALAEPYVLKIQHAGKADETVEHHCTASIGVVVFINHAGSQDDILKWADLAMYQAKDAGRNLIRFYDIED